jgi:hypothetical protein
MVRRRNARHNVRFAYGETTYLGKNKGDDTENYSRMYQSNCKVKKDGEWVEISLLGMPCYHSEFVLQGAQTIKKALGITEHRQLISSLDMYYMLENKYLQWRNEGDLPSYRTWTDKKRKRYGSIYTTTEELCRLKSRLKK